VFLGGADEGVPYSYSSSKYPSEPDASPFIFHGTSSAAGRYWGPHSDMAQGWAWAKRHGLPNAYSACIAALTRASSIVHGGAAVNQFTLFGKKYGAPSGYIKVVATGGNTIAITPLKHFVLLTENAAGTDTRIYVKGNDWVRIGQVLNLGSDSVAVFTRTVLNKGVEINSDGQNTYWIDFTAAVTAITTADYALVCEYDENAIESNTGTFADTQAMLDWVNDNSQVLGAQVHADFTNPATITALGVATALKDIAAWGATTGGDSPAPSSSDYTAFIAYMDAGGWEKFGMDHQKFPQAYCALEGSSTIHATLRDYEVARRTAGFPISMTFGTTWGDTSTTAGNDTDPTFRAGVLNNQGCTLVAGGLDKVAAHLSHAPAVFGRRLEGGVGHNLTNDVLLYTEVEQQWDEDVSGQLTALHRAGVLTYRLSTSGNTVRYLISQGLSTLQNNDVAWNVVTEDTPLLMQRDLADYLDKVFKADLDGTQVGADVVTPEGIAAVIQKRSRDQLKRGRITAPIRIISILLNAASTGYEVKWSVQLPVTNDFITMTTQILVGEA